MKRLPVILVLALALGCEALDFGAGTKTATRPEPAPQPATGAREFHNPVLPDEPQPRGPVHPASTQPGPLDVYAVCAWDMISQPRAEKHSIDQMFDYTESGGVFGPDEKVLALNGLRVARLDLRFREAFGKALDVVRRESKQKTIVRLSEGRAQTFDIGDPLRDVSLFVWTSPDSVLGRHFDRARYSLALTLDKVSPDGVVEYGLSWQANVGAAFQRTVSIPSLDMHVQLEKGQSLLIAPTTLAGRSVDRALISGMDEQTLRLTCIIITPTEFRAAPAPKRSASDDSGGPIEKRTTP